MRSNNVLSDPLQVELAAEMVARTFGANPIIDEDNYYYQKAQKLLGGKSLGEDKPEVTGLNL